MMTFLLICSLILNGAAIFSIILLYMRQNRFIHIEKNQEKLLREMEELFSAYLLEMKEENELFLKRARQITGESSALGENAEKQGRMPAEETGAPHGAEEPKPHDFPSGHAPRYQAVEAYRKNIYADKKNNEPSSPPSEQIGMTDALSRALHLQKQGHTIDEIAKKLNKGKTEIELMLKFYQK